MGKEDTVYIGSVYRVVNLRKMGDGEKESGMKLSENEVILWIFNLELNLDSNVLASAHDWVEAFTPKYLKIHVISTHVGRTKLDPKVRIIELGGGDLGKRVRGLYRLLKLLPELWKFRKNSFVFHHMSPTTVAFIGLPIKFFKIPQGIWYSHASYPVRFRVARRFVNVVFTPTPFSAPDPNQKYRFVGHGISETRFNSSLDHRETVAGEVICLGRVAPVKKIENLIELFPMPKVNGAIENVKLKICGPGDKSPYADTLRNLAKVRNLVLNFTGPIDYSQVSHHLKTADILYSGTEGSVDKAALEGGLMGCLIVSDNPSVLEICGINRAWNEILKLQPGNLRNQLVVLLSLRRDQKEQKRAIIRETSLQNSSLDALVTKITTIFMEMHKTGRT